MKTFKIKAYNENERMSTQSLFQMIYEKVSEGICDFVIDACGQHDIGCALWAKNKNKKLNFKIKNPGQRVGAMALSGTKIVVEGSATADVGWLNSGAEIVVLGNAGDTAAHCAASGKIYIAGSVGTRSGALMKHDPKFNPPQFWVLKNTGSFSFEFMGGGIAVVCGYNCDDLKSVLGNRSCVGMVGGTIYARGNIEGLASCVCVQKLEKSDKDFLLSGMKGFLKEIKKENLYKELTQFSQWKKIVPIDVKQKKKNIPVSEFIKNNWFKGGIFGDLVQDDGKIFALAQAGEARLRKPLWDEKKCVHCDLCLNNCPQKAIVKDSKYCAADEKCIGCGICAAVCPKQAWTLVNNDKI